MCEYDGRAWHCKRGRQHRSNKWFVLVLLFEVRLIQAGRERELLRAGKLPRSNAPRLSSVRMTQAVV